MKAQHSQTCRRIFSFLLTVAAGTVVLSLCLGFFHGCDRTASESVAPVTTFQAPTPDAPAAPATAAPATAAPATAAPATAAPATSITAWVTRVVDGDTLWATLSGQGQEKVRLVGIDAPERDEPLYAEATRALARMVGRGKIQLETDVEERDRYGRLLAYVWVDGSLVNAEMLRLGMARLYHAFPNVKYEQVLEVAEDEARAARRGVWSSP